MGGLNKSVSPIEDHSPVRIEHPVACLAVMAYVYAA